MRSRRCSTSGSLPSNALVTAPATAGSSATSNAIWRSTAITRTVEFGESVGGTGLDANRRQKTSATRCSLDEKYVYAVAAPTPASAATMRIVNPEKPSRLSTPIAAWPSRSTVLACLAVSRRLVDSPTSGLDTCPDTSTTAQGAFVRLGRAVYRLHARRRGPRPARRCADLLRSRGRGRDRDVLRQVDCAVRRGGAGPWQRRLHRSPP